MGQKGPKQTRHWCVTVNARKQDGGEWTEEGLIEAESNLLHLVNVSHLKYAVWQLEKGLDSEVQHLQLYVEFIRPKRMSEAKATLGWGWAHLEPRFGTRDQAREYCRKKDDTHVSGPWEVGYWRPDHEGLKATHRTLADRCVDLVLQGLHPNAVAKRAPAAFFAHHRKVWALYRALNGQEGE